MSLFSEYNPKIKSNRLTDSVTFRQAQKEDIDMVSSITHLREGGDLLKHKKRIKHEILETLHPERKILLVAIIDAVVVGFARAAFIDLSTQSLEPPVPSGIYLNGVIVDPKHRRLGIARELTRLRLVWARKFPHSVYYFVNEHNKTSIRLHKEFGFKEIKRDFIFPGVQFSNGVGLLFVLHF